MCGILGVYGCDLAARPVYDGLPLLQHRGQEGAGIAAICDGEIRVCKGLGLIPQALNKQEILQLNGRAAIGHTRYSTTGANILENTQPLHMVTRHGQIAVAHNGNLVNYAQIRSQLIQEGARFDTTTDTEAILHLINHSDQTDLETAIRGAARMLQGAFCLLILSQGNLFAIRDAHGIRPLVLGKLANGSPIVASESCVLHYLGAEYERDIEPGEMLIINDQGMRSEILFEPALTKECIFEKIYFSHPASMGIAAFRRRIGALLYTQYPTEADFVIPVLDSGMHCAEGYSRASRIDISHSLIRSRYRGDRVFISPDQDRRRSKVREKHISIPEDFLGKSVIVVDDSIVRGDTTSEIVDDMFRQGAIAVHVRISAPPVRHPCYYGIDMATETELIANQYAEIEDIRRAIGATSLVYITDANLMIAGGNSNHCTACFSGNYPTHVPQDHQIYLRQVAKVS